MKWLYYIPEEINPRHRFEFSDMWIKLPGMDHSIWLTIDALGSYLDEHEGTYEDRKTAQLMNQERQDYLDRMGDKNYLYQDEDKTNMIVKADDLSVDDLLEWAKTWIRDNCGDEGPSLELGDYITDFQYTNEDTMHLEVAKRVINEELKQRGILLPEEENESV
jgi:hypothetical protein